MPSADDRSQPCLLDDDPTQLYEQAPCGFLITSPGGAIINVNATFLAWTGYATADVVGRRLTELLDAGGRIFHDTHYAPLLAMRGQVKEMAFTIRCGDGSTLPVFVNAVLDRDGAGEPHLVRVAVFDASERRAYERELLESKRRAEAAEDRALALAQSLQQTLIPPTPPQIPGLEVATAYRPAGRGDEVGGDFYDVFQAGDSWLVLLGDVSGKGTQAAGVATLVRHTVRALAVQMTEPSQILRALNAVLLAHDTDRFCTLAVLKLRHHAGGWELTTSSGGHALPILARDEELLDVGEPGSLVGALDEAVYVDATTALAEDDRLVLYTDGVTEGRCGDEFYGDARFHRILRSPAPTADDLTTAIVDDVVAFQATYPRDDIAVLVLRVL